MSDWEIVQTLGTEEEATLVVGFLEARGVRAEIESLLFHQEPVNFSPLGEVRVRVPSADAERARALLAELPETAVSGEAGESEDESE